MQSLPKLENSPVCRSHFLADGYLQFMIAVQSLIPISIVQFKFLQLLSALRLFFNKVRNHATGI